MSTVSVPPHTEKQGGSPLLVFFLGLVAVLLAFKNAIAAKVPFFDYLSVSVAVLVAVFAAGAVMAKGRFRASFAVLSYLWFILSMAAVSILRGQGAEMTYQAAGIGTFTLLFFLVFWLLVFNMRPALTIDRLMKINIYLSAVIALLGLYQYFFDYTLFGMVTSVYGVVESNITRRAVSVFGSPQTLGIYLAVVVGYLITIPKTRLQWLILLVDMSVMFLSGNKAVFVFFVAFFATYAKIDRRAWRNLLLVGCGLLLFSLALPDTVLVQRMLDPIRFVLTGQGDARVGIWMNVLDETQSVWQLLLGHGVGTAERLLFNRYQYGADSTESYVLKLYYEVGLVGLGWFLAVYLTAIKQAARMRENVRPIFWGFLTNLLFVPAFSGIFISFFFSAFIAKSLTYPEGAKQTGSPPVALPGQAVLQQA